MKSISHLEETKKKLDEVSSSFCIAKWKNSTIHLHNGHTQSCHHVRSQKFNLDISNPSSIHNSEDKKKSRIEMLKGKRPKECSYCWNIEDQGKFSDRIHKSSEDIYLKHLDNVVSSKEGSHISPSFLEISFDNICQFQCMYCNPAYSSSIEKEVRKYGNYPTLGNRINHFYNKSRLPLSKIEKENNIETFWKWWPKLSENLEYLRITGGEPLLSKETFKVIEELSNNPKPNLHFGINSNLGLPTEQTKEIIVKLQKVQTNTKALSLYTSIDTFGPQAEYIRHGLKSDVFWKNVEVALSHFTEKITFCFIITVNCLSLPGLTNLLKAISSLSQKYPQHEIKIDTPYLQYPAHLSIEILPPSFQKYIKEAHKFAKENSAFNELEVQKVDRLSSLIGSNQINPAKLFLLRRDFVKFIEEYSKRKRLNFSYYFPEYVEFFNLCHSPIDNFKSSFS